MLPSKARRSEDSCSVLRDINQFSSVFFNDGDAPWLHGDGLVVCNRMSSRQVNSISIWIDELLCRACVIQVVVDALIETIFPVFDVNRRWKRLVRADEAATLKDIQDDATLQLIRQICAFVRECASP
jgi:hypothetical protein